jgi:hypothetical protein
MQGYSKGSNVPFILVHFSGLLVACMQGYSNGSKKPFISVHYNV